MAQGLGTQLRLMFLSVAFMGLIFPLETLHAAPRGKALFKQCAACHGQKAEGLMNLKAPAIAGLPQWYIEAQLKKFQKGIRGKHPNDIPGMRMRAMAKTLTTKGDIALVAAYVSGLKRASAPATLTGNVESGKAKFALCMACHGPTGEGNKALGAPPLVGSSDWYLMTQIKNFKAGVRGSNATLDPTGFSMSPFAQTLVDDQAIKDVLAYVKTLGPVAK